MALISKPFTFSAGAVIIASQHNSCFDTVYNLVNGALDTNNLASNAAIVDTQLAQITTAGKVSGAAITSISSLPSGAGVVPIANLATGTPTGSKFIRDDGTLQVPSTVGTITAGTSCVKNPLAGGSQTTQAHGLGAIPTFVICYLENVSTELNYAVGDRLPWGGTLVSAGDNGVLFEYDVTNINIIIPTNMPTITNKTVPGGTASLTAAKWKAVAVPYKIN